MSLPTLSRHSTRELLEDDEPVPKVRQMMNEALYGLCTRTVSNTCTREK